MRALIIVCGLLSLLLLKILSSTFKKHNRAKEAARRGCLPPPTLPNKDLLGLRRLKESVRATKEDRGPQYIVDAMNELGFEKVHTIRVPVLDYELLITRDPENVKAMLATQSQDYDIGTHRSSSWGPLLGHGVFTARGLAWKHSRALVRPSFTRDQVTDLDIYSRHFDALVKKLETREQDWTPKVDLSPLFYNFTLDVMTEFLFGQSVHSQDPSARAQLPMSWDPNAPDISQFGHHIDNSKMWIDRRGALAKYNWLLNSKSFTQSCQAVQAFAEYFVRQKLDRLPHEEKNLESDGSQNSRYVLLDELAKETQDFSTLRNELLHVLIAGRDTTAALLGWVFYMLSRHPAVYSKLRHEILNTMPHKDDVSFAKIWAIPYLQYVVNETARIVAVIPMNERAATRDTTLPRGGGPDGLSPIFVPKGHQVLIPKYAMQHRRDIWGDDVEDFKPERWTDRKFGWDFVPFGGGARQCIGQQFGRTEAMFVIVRLLQTFDRLENLEPPGPIRLHHTIECRSGTGVQVRLHGVAAEALAKKSHGRPPFERILSNIELGPERRESVG